MRYVKYIVCNFGERGRKWWILCCMHHANSPFLGRVCFRKAKYVLLQDGPEQF